MSSDKYLARMQRPEVGGSRDADPALPFSAQDWKDGQAGYLPLKNGKPNVAGGLRKPDWERWFPNTDDLRVLDWLGAEADEEEPYDAETDTMSAAGAQVPRPKDYDDFPKARGYYTHYGGWHGGWKNAPGW